MRIEARLAPFGGLWRSRLARNWSYLVVSNVAAQALGMVATIRIARALAPEGYGQFNLVLTVAALATQLVGLGLRDVVIRECARRPEQSAAIFSAAAALRAAALALVGAGVLLYSALTPDWLPLSFAAIAVFLLVSQATWALVENVVFGRERMGYSAGITFAGSAIWVVVAWGVPGSWITPLLVSLAFTVLQAIKALVFFGMMRRSIAVHPGAQAVAWLPLSGGLLAAGLPFFWSELMSTTDTLLPILLLAARSGEAEVGLYNAGFRLIYPISMLIQSALVALYPTLSRAGVNDGEAFMRTTRRALVGITLAATTLAIAASLLRREVVVFLFGDAFLGAADAMAYQCWYIVLQTIFSVIGTVFAARDKQVWMAWLATSYTVVVVPLVWWGTARGAAGLSQAILIAAVINLAYYWIVFQRSLPEPLPLKFGLGAVAIVASGMAVTLLIPPSWPFLLRLLVAVGLVGLLCIGALRQWQQRQAERG